MELGPIYCSFQESESSFQPSCPLEWFGIKPYYGENGNVLIVDQPVRKALKLSNTSQEGSFKADKTKWKLVFGLTVMVLVGNSCKGQNDRIALLMIFLTNL